MRELVVISGKGGTGKTSVVAALATLAGRAVLADCDVDAADLHLLLAPRERRREPFMGGVEAVIRADDCVGCGGCLTYCRFDAVRMTGQGAGEATFRIEPVACEGCGVCAQACPVQAIDLVPRQAGDWFVADTRLGPLVHARLRPGADNSGKLVTQVRTEARRLALTEDHEWLLVDGPPGIGCPVIASLTGARRALVVTEPTVAGAHDLRRVLALAAHFAVPTMVLLNKWDIAPEQADTLETVAREGGATVVGRIPHDPAFTAAMVAGRTIPEHGPGPARDALARAWEIIAAN